MLQKGSKTLCDWNYFCRNKFNKEYFRSILEFHLTTKPSSLMWFQKLMKVVQKYLVQHWSKHTVLVMRQESAESKLSKQGWEFATEMSEPLSTPSSRSLSNSKTGALPPGTDINLEVDLIWITGRLRGVVLSGPNGSLGSHSRLMKGFCIKPHDLEIFLSPLQRSMCLLVDT